MHRKNAEALRASADSQKVPDITAYAHNSMRWLLIFCNISHEKTVWLCLTFQKSAWQVVRQTDINSGNSACARSPGGTAVPLFRKNTKMNNLLDKSSDY